MLSQVASCVVLCRHQVRRQKHVHGEQPQRSHMLKLPYVQEIFRYMIVAQPDLRTAGEMRDPQKQKFMKKGLDIVTSSRNMHSALDHLKCQGKHEHQPIEGSTAAHGLTVAWSAFSELYPRKFARLVAKNVLKAQFPSEKPVGQVHDPLLCLFDQVLALDARSSKRPKGWPTPFCQEKSADRSLSSPEDIKRRKVEKCEESPMDENPGLQQKFSNCHGHDWAQLAQNRKKSDRSTENNAANRGPVSREYHKGDHSMQRNWTNNGSPKEPKSMRSTIPKGNHQVPCYTESFCWSWMGKIWSVSNRQLIRKSFPSRVNINVFAANPSNAHLQLPALLTVPHLR